MKDEENAKNPTKKKNFSYVSTRNTINIYRRAGHEGRFSCSDLGKLASIPSLDGETQAHPLPGQDRKSFPCSQQPQHNWSGRFLVFPTRLAFTCLPNFFLYSFFESTEIFLLCFIFLVLGRVRNTIPSYYKLITKRRASE